MRKIIFLLLGFLLPQCGFAGRKVCLDGTWRFAYAKDSAAAEAMRDFWKAGPGTVAAGGRWDDVPVPSNWAVLGYEEPVYRGFKDNAASEGFYVKDFTLPADKDADTAAGGQRWTLRFGGVWQSAEVWLNGKYMGRHDSGYTSFSFNVTDMVRTDGGMNRLAVRVRQVTPTYKFDTCDDWTLGGIFRSVSLEALPKLLWIDHVQTDYRMNGGKDGAGRLTARVFVSDVQKSSRPGNYPSPGCSYQLRARLTDGDGREVAAGVVTVPAHVQTGRQSDFMLDVRNPRLWNAETPELYTLSVSLYIPKGAKLNGISQLQGGIAEDALADGDVADIYKKGADEEVWAEKPLMTWQDKIGLREISTKNAAGQPALCINGQPVKLRGVNYHNEYPTVGRAQTREMWIKDLEQMKRTNINYLRLCHYPHDEEFMHLCDSIGMYCSEEINLGGASVLMYDQAYNGAVLQRVYETVTRDLNRPSVICWTVGNEDAFTALHQAAARVTKALDPTRPRLIPWRYENWLPEDDIDILSVHYWQPAECDSLIKQANRPVISTEYTHAFGTHGMGGLDQRWRAFADNTAGAGAAIWMWQDQGLKLPTPLANGKKNVMARGDEYLRISSAGWDGIVDSYRRQGRDWEETRATYMPVYPLLDTVKVHGGDRQIAVELYNAYDFTDMASVRIDWKLYDAGGKLAAGNAAGKSLSVSAAPHKTAYIHVPLKKNVGKGAYLHLTFRDNEGQELGRRSIYIDVEADGKEGRGRRNAFDSRKVESVLSSIRPVVWRKPDVSEESVVGKKLVRKMPDIRKFTVRKLSPTHVVYEYDKDNTVDFEYSVTETEAGTRVDYRIKAVLSVPRVPIAGVELTFPGNLSDLKWRGLGPSDCYPNKFRAGLEGVWSYSDGLGAGGGYPGDNVFGTKRMSWVETNGYHIDHDGYLEIEGKTVRLLMGVAARPEKGRRADSSFPSLGTEEADPAFSGHFIIRGI